MNGKNIEPDFALSADTEALSDQFVGLTLTSTRENVTITTPLNKDEYSLGAIVTLSLLTAVIIVITIVANFVVLLSFVLDIAIRQPTNYFIASLAVSDLLIGFTSMPLYTAYLLLGEWPLGSTACDLWLSLDWSMCNASKLTVLAITVDRFCSVKIPIKYRNWRNARKVKVIIVILWLTPTIVFFTTIIGWQYFVGERAMKTGICNAPFMQNAIFGLLLLLVSFWITLALMCALYIGIYRKMLELQRKADIQPFEMTRAGSAIEDHTICIHDCKQQEIQNSSISNHTTCHVTTQLNLNTNEAHTSGSYSRAVTDDKRSKSLNPMPRDRKGSRTFQSGRGKKLIEKIKHLKSFRLSSVNKEMTKNSKLKRVQSKSALITNMTTTTVGQKSPNSETLVGTKIKSDTSPATSHAIKKSNGTDSRSLTTDTSVRDRKLERFLYRISRWKTSKKIVTSTRPVKALRIITLILGAYILCWTPFNILILVYGFCPGGQTCVNSHLYKISYWICYLNSSINPFCYALANARFRKTFFRILKFDWHRF